MANNNIIKNIAGTLICLMVAFLTTVRADAFTVVVDAGHGGNDGGTSGAKIVEKDINLAVAQRVANLLLAQKDIKVVMTRSTDVSLGLQERCDIANAAKGDIFVSIHTNSLKEDKPGREKVKGTMVFTMGLDKVGKNLDVAIRENEVIKLEDDYSTQYAGYDPNSPESAIMFELAQNSTISKSINLANLICNELVTKAGRVNNGVKQGPFRVLVGTTMPSVLVELDFICNPEVEEFLGSEKGRDQMADAIASGIIKYKKGVTAVTKKGAKPTKDLTRKDKPADKPKPAKQTETQTPKPAKKDNKNQNTTAQTNKSGVTTFRIQFLTSGKALKESDERLKNFNDAVTHYTDNGIVKYTVGDFKTMRDAQKVLTTVKERFPDAFIIMWKDGQRIK